MHKIETKVGINGITFNSSRDELVAYIEEESTTWTGKIELKFSNGLRGWLYEGKLKELEIDRPKMVMIDGKQFIFPQSFAELERHFGPFENRTGTMVSLCSGLAYWVHRDPDNGYTIGCFVDGVWE